MKREKETVAGICIKDTCKQAYLAKYMNYQAKFDCPKSHLLMLTVYLVYPKAMMFVRALHIKVTQIAYFIISGYDRFWIHHESANM